VGDGYSWVIGEKGVLSREDWLRYPKPNSWARLRLFCLPYAGGGAATFHAWPKALPEEVELCAIELPGRGSRWQEAPLRCVPEVVQILEEVLRPVLDKPYAFFGHSLGALIAFEMARRLQPCHLFVSGRAAPQLPNPDPPIHRLPDEEFVQVLQRRYQGIPEAVLQETELLKLLLPVLRADVAMVATYTYTPGEPLNCPITAFGGREDTNTTRSQLIAWAEQTRRAFSLEMFPGNHFFLNDTPGPLLRVISSKLAPVLEKDF
jgi:medium-chain acyl-[acyl-carrier-protein] hydrolase